MYVHTYVRMHVCMYVCIYLRTHIRVHVLNVHIYACKYARIYVYVRTHARIYVCMHACMHAYSTSHASTWPIISDFWSARDKLRRMDSSSLCMHAPAQHVAPSLPCTRALLFLLRWYISNIVGKILVYICIHILSLIYLRMYILYVHCICLRTGTCVYTYTRTHTFARKYTYVLWIRIYIRIYIRTHAQTHACAHVHTYV